MVGVPEPFWPAVRAQLKLVFPAIPDGAWTDMAKRSRRVWLNSASVVHSSLYASDHDIVVFAPQRSSCGCSHAARFPEEGRSMIVDASLPRCTLAHELGHHLGLRHPWEGMAGKDPVTLVPWAKADAWDLQYKAGTSAANPHVFFDDRAGAAAAGEPNLKSINQRPSLVDPSDPSKLPLRRRHRANDVRDRRKPGVLRDRVDARRAHQGSRVRDRDGELRRERDDVRDAGDPHYPAAPERLADRDGAQVPPLGCAARLRRRSDSRGASASGRIRAS